MATRRRTNPETAIQRDMLALLRLRGVRAHRRNVAGALPVAGASGKVYRVKFGEKGQSDIYGIIPVSIPGRRWTVVGLHLELEVKAPGNRPTDAQFAWLRECEAAGAIAIWSDSTTHLDAIIGHVLRGARTRIAPDGGIDLEYP